MNHFWPSKRSLEFQIHNASDRSIELLLHLFKTLLPCSSAKRKKVRVKCKWPPNYESRKAIIHELVDKFIILIFKVSEDYLIGKVHQSENGNVKKEIILSSIHVALRLLLRLLLIFWCFILKVEINCLLFLSSIGPREMTNC